MNTATQTRNLKLIKRERFLKLSQTEFPEEKQQLLEEKDADNTRKVLCKSFIHSFIHSQTRDFAFKDATRYLL